MTADTDRKPVQSPGDLVREIVRAFYGGRDIDLAKDVGVNRSTIGRWISEERAISAIELFRVVAIVTSGHQEREAQVSAWLLELAGFEGLEVKATEADPTPRVWEREQVDDMGIRARMAKAVLDEDALCASRGSSRPSACSRASRSASGSGSGTAAGGGGWSGEPPPPPGRRPPGEPRDAPLLGPDRRVRGDGPSGPPPAARRPRAHPVVRLGDGHRRPAVPVPGRAAARRCPMTPSELFEAEFVTCVPACLLCDGGTEPVDLCVSPTILVEDDDESPGVTLDVLADDGATRELVALSLDGAELLGRELLRAAAQARGRHGAARGEA